MKVLFVCVGNTCRSQMAEAICKSLGHSADSAGTHPGSEVNPNAIRALEEKGIESAGLRPKSIDDIVTDGYDKIISMGCGVHCPNIRIDYDWGLDDPHGKPLEIYRSTRDSIIELLSDLIEKETDA